LAIQVFQHDTFDDRQFRRVFTTLLNMFAAHAGCFVYHGGSNLQVRSETNRRLCQARFVKEQLLTVRHSIGDPTLTAVQIGQVLAMQSMMMATHCVHEFIAIKGEARPAAPVVATNVYMRSGNGWKMLLHHSRQEFVEETVRPRKSPKSPRSPRSPRMSQSMTFRR
jgi:hypothetical protein